MHDKIITLKIFSVKRSIQWKSFLRTGYVHYVKNEARKCAVHGGKENMFGGSVCASADLLPPAGDGWHSLAEVRDGNAPPLGNP